MAHRRKTLRRMLPMERKIARLAGVADSLGRRLNNLLPEAHLHELMSRASEKQAGSGAGDQKRIKALEEALAPFANIEKDDPQWHDAAKLWGLSPTGYACKHGDLHAPTWGDVRRAARRSTMAIVRPKGRLPSEYIRQGWCQGDAAERADDSGVYVGDPEAVKWCAIGAANAVWSGWENQAACDIYLHGLAAMLGVASLPQWNDAPGQTQEAVATAMERYERDHISWLKS